MRSATVVLPVPGLPVKLMCSDGAPARELHVAAHLVDDQQRGDLADALLDRREADQLGIELVEHGLHAGSSDVAGQRAPGRRLGSTSGASDGRPYFGVTLQVATASGRT